MALQSVRERLRSLRKSVSQAVDLTTRLEELTYEPISVQEDPDDGAADAELSSEIQQILKDVEEGFEILEQEIRDIHPGRPGSQIALDQAHLIEKFAEDVAEVKRSRHQFRNALLSTKHSYELAQRYRREELLLQIEEESSSSDSSSLLQGKNTTASAELSQDEEVIAAASDVTAALRRTHALMQTELSRSQFAHDTLQESTAALAQLGETYSSLDTMLAKSRNLLGTLLRSNKSDTWYLETAFYVLLATIVWLVFRRFIYGPAWWILWLPLKTFYTMCMSVFAAVGLGGGRVSNAPPGPGVTVISEPVISEHPSLIVHGSATIGEAHRPSIFEVRPSSINVGDQRIEPSPAGTQAAGSGSSLVEEVGKIIDESQREGDGEHQERASEQVVPPNPKKRMWEEEKEEAKQAAKEVHQMKKDEL